MYANTRPESPKGQVFIAFCVKGEDSATRLAEKLEITPARYNRFFREWGDAGHKAGKGLPKTSAAAAAPVKKAPVKKAAMPAKKTAAKKAAPVKKAAAAKKQAPKKTKAPTKKAKKTTKPATAAPSSLAVEATTQTEE